ncbi:MAG: carbohydrate kinase [Methylococcales bacterium]
MSKNNNHPIALFGEVLIDQFPEGHRILGGAPFNVAWHLHAFGQNPCFISRIGNDETGQLIQNAMSAWGMSMDALQIDPIHPTGTVAVTFEQGEPRYEILIEQAYDFINAETLNLTAAYPIIYHGTLALRHPVSEQTLKTLSTQTTGKIFIDVNLRAPWWQKEAVNNWLSTAHWVKLNHEELMALFPVQNSLQNSLRETMQRFLTQHKLEVLVITCGHLGAKALSQDGEFIEVFPSDQLSVVDTVGAGDAFSAVLLLGLHLGWSLSTTMASAQAFASASVTQQGATVQTLDFYQAFINEWHLSETYL